VSARPITIALAGLLATMMAGCGISNPYQTQSSNRHAVTSSLTTSTSTTTMTAADAGDPPSERRGTIPASTQAAQSKLAADASSLTPRAALERYASLYANWQASNLAARQGQLASVSLGPARAQALQAAASAARDPELTRSQVANQGQVIAITEGTGAAAGEWVLVTRERTTGQGDYAGLPPALHVIYAQLTRYSHGWVIVQWKPQT
jgi:hypothetical protein